MGVAELREAFNVGAHPHFTCQRAWLGYESKDNVQFQRLTFHGTGVDGAAFETRSDLLRPESDVIAAARVVGENMAASVKPLEESKS